jgi:hypothetical protein
MAYTCSREYAAVSERTNPFRESPADDIIKTGGEKQTGI